MHYVGPAYTNGLLLAGETRPVRPADMSADERATFLKRHPERAGWWKEIDPEPPAPTPAEEEQSA